MSVRTDYASLRKAGYNAQQAFGMHRVIEQWRELESEGYVRLRCKPDEDYQLGEFESDNPHEHARALKAERELVERDGAWGVIGEYRPEPCAQCGWSTDECEHAGWSEGGSIWGMVGYSDYPLFGGYGPDVMAETMDAWSHARLLLVA